MAKASSNTPKAFSPSPDATAIPIERHPLSPFLPSNAQLLMLGSFPPQEKRWAMRFFYPNFINDMWRIFGLCFFGDLQHFVLAEQRTFKEQALREFLSEKGIAFYDTAVAVRRLSGNASDKDLEIVEPTHIPSLLKEIPKCKAIATTGQKATETLCTLFGVKPPAVGEAVKIEFENREFLFFRMPSSSRAYPMKIEKKATIYAKMFEAVELL